MEKIWMVHEELYINLDDVLMARKGHFGKCLLYLSGGQTVTLTNEDEFDSIMDLLKLHARSEQ